MHLLSTTLYHLKPSFTTRLNNEIEEESHCKMSRERERERHPHKGISVIMLLRPEAHHERAKFFKSQKKLS